MKKILCLCALVGVLWGQTGCVKSEPYNPALGSGTFEVKFNDKALIFKKYTATAPKKGNLKLLVEVEDPANASQIAVLSVDMYNVQSKTTVFPLSTPIKPEELTRPYYYTSLATTSTAYLFKSGTINITSWNEKSVGIKFDNLDGNGILTGKMTLYYQ